LHPTTRAVRRYHDLLAETDAAALSAELEAQQVERGVTFGGRPVCSVLRPHFLHPRDFATIARATEAVVGAVHTIYAAMRAGRLDMAALLHLSEAEEAILAVPERYGRPDASTRMDAFFHPGERPGEGEVRFLEYNAESPGGIAFGEVLGEIFLEQAPMRRFRREFAVRTAPLRALVYDTLVACYRDWAAATGITPHDPPAVAIVDWREARTANEFVLSAEVFEARGSPVVICDPDELAYAGDRLVAREMPVDIVYKRVVVDELIARAGTLQALVAHPLVRADRDGAVCVVNGLGVQALYSKAFFAQATDERTAGLLGPAEAEAVRRHVPWTRVVAERRTRVGGREVDLVEHVRAEREGLVLKPVKSYGGRGVVLGWETGQGDWERAIEAALDEPTIVQRRVPVPRELFPVYDGGLELAGRFVDVDPYVWRGREVHHAGVRLGTGPVLNVTAGGGSATPLFLVEAVHAAG